MNLTCTGLGVRIGDRLVVNRLDQEFHSGQFWGVLGANGAGKTTLLRHLAGLLPAAHGQVQVGERPLQEWPRRELARVLGMLQQHTTYVFEASVLEIALVGRHPWLGAWQPETPADLEIARTALRCVDLDGLEDRNVTSLSGGEARRLAFAVLLTQQVPLMLLDEPTNHLDFRHQVRVMREVGDRVYQRQQLALAALHDVNLAATYCSHVLLLYGGGDWAAGPASELLNSGNLQRLYQCPVTSVETPDGPRFHPSFSELSE